MTPAQEAELGRLMVEAQNGDRRRLRRAVDARRRASCRRLSDAGRRRLVVGRCGAGVLVALHRARHTYDSARPFAPWLYAIAQNRLVDALRVQRRRLLREIQPELTPEPSQPAAAGARRPAGRRAPRRRRRCPTTSARSSSSSSSKSSASREVATRLGMSEANVKVTAHRGYRALRRRIEEWTRAD